MLSQDGTVTELLYVYERVNFLSGMRFQYYLQLGTTLRVFPNEPSRQVCNPENSWIIIFLC